MLHRCCYLLLLWLLTTSPLRAQTPVEWTTNHAPFRVVGNLYYVGSNDLATYLLTTPKGNILLNANLASSVPQIRQNIEALGFRLADTKILLISQAHFDHVGGTAELQRLTGAQLAVMDADVPVMESGGRDDFAYYNRPDLQFAPAKVDRTLHDGEQVKLGGTRLTAHLTAGHTKGTTTWTLDVAEAGRTHHVLIFGGATANEGNNLLNDLRYPQQAADFERTFAKLRALPCDIFLGTHGVYFQLQEKYPRLHPNSPTFLDPAGYRAYVADRERAFRAELARQTAAQSK